MLGIQLISSGGMPLLLPLQVVGLVPTILYVIILLMIVLTFLNIYYIMKNTKRMAKHLENIETEIINDNK
jgi:predicted acyltransferase